MWKYSFLLWIAVSVLSCQFQLLNYFSSGVLQNLLMLQQRTYWHQRADQMKSLLRKLKWKWSGHHVWRQAPLKTRPLWWMSPSTAAAHSLFKKWLSEEALHQQRTLSWEATTTRILTHSCLMKINDIYSEPQPLGFTTPAPHFILLCGCTSYLYLYSSYPPYHVVHVVYMCCEPQCKQYW